MLVLEYVYSWFFGLNDKKLVVVTDSDIFNVSIDPSKANAPLLVNANTVLSSTISLQRLQPIARWHPQKINTVSGLNETKLAERNRLNVRRQLLREDVIPNFLSFLVRKANNHKTTLCEKRK